MSDLSKIGFSKIVETWEKEDHWGGVKAVVVSGYLGAPTNALNGNKVNADGWYRLYRTLDFQDYIEFPDNDQGVTFVFHVEHDKDELGKVTIWFDPATPVRYIQNFVAGEIANLFLPEVELGSRLAEDRFRAATLVARSWAGCTTNSQCQ